MSFIRLFVFSVLVVYCALAQAQNHQVKLVSMAEGGQSMLMSPGFIKIAAGDSITFIPSDATHNVESIMIPSAAAPFNSAMGVEVTITFTEQGVYLYKCTPHFALGMLGVVQVGKPTNLQSVTKHWQNIKAGVVMNQTRVDQYLAQVK